MAKNKENTEDLNEKIQQEEINETVESTTEENVETTENQSEEEADKAKIAELNEKYVRLYSDFDNYRKRTIREKADIISNASAEVIKDLLPVLDDFERAIANNENMEEGDSIKEGFQLIYNKFKNILVAKGLESMEAKGNVFDPELHEAITNIPAPSDEMKGKVVDVIERGYMLKGKMLRYAKVVVGQ